MSDNSIYPLPDRGDYRVLSHLGEIIRYFLKREELVDWANAAPRKDIYIWQERVHGRWHSIPLFAGAKVAS